MKVLEEIKILLINSHVKTLTELVERLNLRYGREDSLQNLHRKLSKETIKYKEVKEIAEELGYKIEFIPISKKE